MVTGAFGLLLQELSIALKIPNLQPDSNDSCLIRMNNGLRLQIEMDLKSDALLMAIDLGEVPLGRFRVDLFREALKTNNSPNGLNGRLAYSKKQNHLILFEKINSNFLITSIVIAKIPPLLQKAATWIDVLKTGVMPLPEYTVSAVGSTTNPFGLSR